MVALSLLYWSIYLCFRYFDRFRTVSCNFHLASSNFPASIPFIFLNFPPSINPLLHALKTELFFPPRVCSSATHLFVHFQKYLRTPKQYSFIQQRTLAWANSSRRARRHVWCWVEFHPHHCLRGVLGQPPLLKIGTWQVETNHLTLNEICMIWVKTMVELGGPPNCWNTYLTINNALMRRK